MTTQVFGDVVVQDPSGGSVIGAAQLGSPAGACAGDPALTGPAQLTPQASRAPDAGAPTGSVSARPGNPRSGATELDRLVVQPLAAR